MFWRCPFGLEEIRAEEARIRSEVTFCILSKVHKQSTTDKRAIHLTVAIRSCRERLLFVSFPFERHDVSWLRRIGVLALFIAMALLLVTPSIIHSRRAAQFESVCRVVASQGGSLSFDLQGDYLLTLAGVAASDETVETLLPRLHALPSGFTLIGPGEGRHFYVQLNHSNITARGLTDLCSLPITSITLTDCPNLDDNAVDALATLRNPHAIINGDVRISPSALERLRKRMQNAFPKGRV